MGYSLIPFIISIVFLLVGFFVITRRSRATNLTFSLLCFATFVWQGAWAILFQTRNPILAIFLIKTGYLAIIFLPTFMYHFLEKISGNKTEWKWVKLSYIIATLLAISLLFSDFFVSGYYVFFWGYYPKAGVLHPIHVLQTMVVVLRGSYLVLKKIWRSENMGSQPISYVGIGLLVYFLAAIDYLCNYGVEFYPPGVLFLSIYLSITAYAITKHDLMDIRVAITKAGAFLVTLVIFAILYLAGITWPYLTFISHQIDFGFLALSVTYGGFIVGLFFQKVQQFLVTTAEKKFLSGTYNTEKILQNLSSELVYVADRIRVMQIISEEFARSMELKSVHALIPEADGYKAMRVQWANEQVQTVVDNPIALDGATVSELIGFGSEPRLWTTISKSMQQTLLSYGIHEGSLILSLNSLENLEGVLILGPKLTEDKYTDHDITVFSFITNQIMVVFDRILYQEKLKEANDKLETVNAQLGIRVAEETALRKKAIEVAQELSHQASLSMLASGVSHEVRNPMTTLQGYMSFMADQFGLDSDVIIDETDDGDEVKYVVWHFRVEPAHFIHAVGGDERLAKRVVDELVAQGYLTEDRKFTDKIDWIQQDVSEVDLGDAFRDYKEEIQEALLAQLRMNNVFDYCNVAIKQYDRILNMADKMITYGMSGKEVDKKEAKPIDISKNIHNAHSVLKGITRKTGVEFEFDIDPKLPPVWGDDLRMQQVWFNVMYNAVQALEKEPEAKKKCIRTTAHLCQFVGHEGKKIPGIEIHIADNGPGIPEEVMDKIFNPFFSTKAPTGGKNAGIGLSIVRDVVMSHKGLVEVKSEVGVGTTFIIYLPV
jgi:signal transduction histidine kinase